MSIYYATDAGPASFLCNNRGWGDFGRWAEALSVDHFPAIIHLWEYGWYEPVRDLARELPAAVAAHPPTAPGLDKVIGDLSETTSRLRPALTIIITNGIRTEKSTAEKKQKKTPTNKPPAKTGKKRKKK